MTFTTIASPQEDSPATFFIQPRAPFSDDVPIEYTCARQLAQVEAAWRLVYQCYVAAGLIDANPWSLHATPSAVGVHSRVIVGAQAGTPCCTMTLSHESAEGLALDCVCGKRLDALRAQGRRMLEVGMLAVHPLARRGGKRLSDLMRWAVQIGLQHGSDDILIGVHPRHAAFYGHQYGMEAFAPESRHPLVRNHPVVVLRLRLGEIVADGRRVPRGLARALAQPLTEGALAGAFTFETAQMRGSLLEAWLAARNACTHGIPAFADWRTRQDSNLRPVT